MVNVVNASPLGWGWDGVRLRDRKKQESRARVLEAARELFAEIGFEKTTVRTII